ncbi:MAG TPA: hypothetical protein VL523_00360, partial [Terriglobia bacterium]|nr:hypothetical protein [Terriglobia bacterium]
RSLQFSFVTKLAHTVNPKYSVYDSKIAAAFSFAPRYSKKIDQRLEPELAFYSSLCATYKEIVACSMLERHIRVFRNRYGPAAGHLPDIKIIDFVFWSAGGPESKADPTH